MVKIVTKRLIRLEKMRELSQKYLKHHFKYSRHFDSNKIKFSFFIHTFYTTTNCRSVLFGVYIWLNLHFSIQKRKFGVQHTEREIHSEMFRGIRFLFLIKMFHEIIGYNSAQFCFFYAHGGISSLIRISSF